MSKSKPCVLIFSRTYTHVANYTERNTCLQHQTPGTICPNDFWCDWISLHGRWPVCPIVPAADLVSNEDPVTMYRLWSSMGGRFLAWPSSLIYITPLLLCALWHHPTLSLTLSSELGCDPDMIQISWRLLIWDVQILSSLIVNICTRSAAASLGLGLDFGFSNRLNRQTFRN